VLKTCYYTLLTAIVLETNAINMKEDTLIDPDSKHSYS